FQRPGSLPSSGPGPPPGAVGRQQPFALSSASAEACIEGLRAEMPALEWVEASGEVSSFQAPQAGGLRVFPRFLWGGGVGRTGSRQDTAVLPPNAPPNLLTTLSRNT